MSNQGITALLAFEIPKGNLSSQDLSSNIPTIWGCPGVPVHEGIPFVFITIHGVMTQFVNVSFLCVPVHEDTTYNLMSNAAILNIS